MTPELAVILAIVLSPLAFYIFWFEPALTRKDEEITLWRERALLVRKDPPDLIQNVRIIDGSEPDDGGDPIDFLEFYDAGEEL